MTQLLVADAEVRIDLVAQQLQSMLDIGQQWVIGGRHRSTKCDVDLKNVF